MQKNNNYKKPASPSHLVMQAFCYYYFFGPSGNFLGLSGRARKVFPLTGKAHDVACPSLTCTNPYITPGDLTNVKTLHGVFEHVVVKDEVQQGLCGGVQGTSLYGSRGCGFCLHIDIKHNMIDVITVY